MTRRDLLPGESRPVDLAHPGNAHLIACECTHLPEQHIEGVGCIAVVEVVDRWTGGRQSLGEDFCPCTSYGVAP